MKCLSMKVLSRSALTVLFGSFLLACSGSGAGFPQIAEPPPFDYIDGQELRSRMHQLAFELQMLDLSLMTSDDSRPELQDEVLGSLRDIERIANLLREGDMSTTHTFLQADMDYFLTTVQRARMNVESNPPRYYMAGRVSGACVNCHRANR